MHWEADKLNKSNKSYCGITSIQVSSKRACNSNKYMSNRLLTLRLHRIAWCLVDTVHTHVTIPNVLCSQMTIVCVKYNVQNYLLNFKNLICLSLCACFFFWKEVQLVSAGREGTSSVLHHKSYVSKPQPWTSCPPPPYCQSVWWGWRVSCRQEGRTGSASKASAVLLLTISITDYSMQICNTLDGSTKKESLSPCALIMSNTWALYW